MAAPASIEIRGMAPLLQVFDMPASIAFYRDKMGFPVDPVCHLPHDDVDWVMFRINDVQVMLNTAYEKPERPPFPDPARIAAHEDTAVYFGCLILMAHMTILFHAE